MKTFKEYLTYCKQHNVDITKWKLDKLHEKVMSEKVLSESEYLAKLFLEEMCTYFK